MRTIEAVVALFVATIGVCYFIEIFVLPQTQPNFLEMGRALFTPELSQAGMILVAIGIIGATVMPHNLYLHSALVQTRKLETDEPVHPPRPAVQHHRLDRRPGHRFLRQRGDPGPGGDGLLRQGERDRAGR